VAVVGHCIEYMPVAVDHFMNCIVVIGSVCCHSFIAVVSIFSCLFCLQSFETVVWSSGRAYSL